MKNRDHILNIEELLHTAIFASLEAGNSIMSIYNSNYAVELKSDESPLTIADKNAHQIIIDFLKSSNIPIISEEGEKISYSTRKNWNLVWIVDPLDGTKEFIKHNDEFTVNICLVKEQRPIMGVVYCPPLKTIYFAAQNIHGAFKAVLCDTTNVNISELVIKSEKLSLSRTTDNIRIVASRTHMNEETLEFISTLREKYDKLQFISKGSSLKFCLVAEGSADIYPRFAPTCEWDTAAAQAIVEFAGGEVVNALTNSPLTYNKENLLNPSFVVRAK